MELAVWEILLVAGGLSLDVFAYCLWKGAVVSELNKKDVVRLVVLFSVFQIGGLLLGNGITFIPAIRSHVSEAHTLWIVVAAIIFFGIGAYMIVRAILRRNVRIEEKKEDRYNYRIIAFWAFITCLDAILAGLSFGFLSVNFLLVLILTAISTVIGALLGLFLGYRLGCGPRNKMIAVGGCIVAVGGVDVLVHLFY